MYYILLLYTSWPIHTTPLVERGCHRSPARFLGGIFQDSRTSKNHTVVNVSWDISDEHGFHTDSTTVRGRRRMFCPLDLPFLQTIQQCCGKNRRDWRDHQQASTCRSWIEQIEAEIVRKVFFTTVALQTLLVPPCMQSPLAQLTAS